MAYYQSTAESLFENVATGVLIVIILTSLALARLSRRSKTTLPPGPPGDPFLGHLRAIPLSYSWHLFSKWGKTFGEIFYIHICGQPMIVLSSFAAARELMEKRGRNYSDRARMVTQSELMGWGATLTPQGVTAYHSLIEVNVRSLLENFEKSPEEFREYIHHCVACIVIRVTYGYDYKSITDPRKLTADKVNAMTIAGGNAGATIADFIPLLYHLPSWFPGAGFKRHAAETNRVRQMMFNDLYDYAWSSKMNGSEKPSIMSQLLEKYGDRVKDDQALKDTIKAVGGVMYVAGVDTTDVTISTFLLLMTIHPNIAKRAQRDIDAVTNGKRLPTFADRANIPYVDCIMKELWRWNPPVPMGIYHFSREEDDYNGMTIPAKSTIVPNMWHMLRDDAFYPDPFTFYPERFMPLVQSSYLPGYDPSPSASDPKSIVFGFGRRICPGMNLADATIWLALACILASFDILAPIDPVTGKENIPEEKFLSHFTR